MSLLKNLGKYKNINKAGTGRKKGDKRTNSLEL